MCRLLRVSILGGTLTHSSWHTARSTLFAWGSEEFGKCDTGGAKKAVPDKGSGPCSFKTGLQTEANPPPDGRFTQRISLYLSHQHFLFLGSHGGDSVRSRVWPEKVALAWALFEGDSFLVNIPQTHGKSVFAAERSRHPLRRWFRRGYICVAILFVLCVIFQVFMAGAGILVAGFWLGYHAAFGYFIIFLPLLLLPLGLLARLPRSLNWLSGLLAVLALIQPMLLWGKHLGLPLLAALHPVNALLLFALTLFLGGRTWSLVREV